MKRLEAIFSLIQPCEVFADIGCDHGFISKYVLENKLAKKVIAADISAKCLQKAQKLLNSYDNIQFICTDGLKGIDASLAVIAGMGGNVIIGILKDKLKSKNQLETQFILQPQDHAYEVRQFLINSGYKITTDFVTKERGKFYDIIYAEKGSQSLDEFQLQLGAFYNKKESHDDNIDMKISNQILKERLKKEYQKLLSISDKGKNQARRDFLAKAILAMESNQSN